MDLIDKLPDDLFMHIMCNVTDAKDVASSSCVSKKWHGVMAHRKGLEFSEKLFGNLRIRSSERIMFNMVSSVHRLETLVVSCRFSGSCLATLLCMCGNSLKRLQILGDKVSEVDHPDKMDVVRGCSMKLECLKVSSLEMSVPPRWVLFPCLHTLEIGGGFLVENSLNVALKACPNLIHLSLVCEGTSLKSVTIANVHIESCKVYLLDVRDGILTVSSSKLALLDTLGFESVTVRDDLAFLKTVTVSNFRVSCIKGGFASVQSLALKGSIWSWDVVNMIFETAISVQKLVVDITSVQQINGAKSFPSIQFGKFIDGHSQLQYFDILGGLFKAFATQLDFDSLENCDNGLVEVSVKINSSKNGEGKMKLLNAIVKHSKSLKKLRVNASDVKTFGAGHDSFVDDLDTFCWMNKELISFF